MTVIGGIMYSYVYVCTYVSKSTRKACNIYTYIHNCIASWVCVCVCSLRNYISPFNFYFHSLQLIHFSNIVNLFPSNTASPTATRPIVYSIIVVHNFQLFPNTFVLLRPSQSVNVSKPLELTYSCACHLPATSSPTRESVVGGKG